MSRSNNDLRVKLQFGPEEGRLCQENFLVDPCKMRLFNFVNWQIFFAIFSSCFSRSVVLAVKY